MSNYPKLTITHDGQDMIAEAEADKKPLIFTRVDLGDGQLSPGQNVETLTAPIGSKMKLPLSSGQKQSTGGVKLRFVVDNSALETGFFAREIAVHAKVGESGTERLYAYTNGGNYVDYIPDKSNPIDAQIIDVYLVTGNAENVQIVVSSSTYATVEDVRDEIKVHNSAPDAHADIRLLIENAGINLLRRNRAYAVGDIAYSKNLPSWARLECVKAGTTATEEPVAIASVSTGGVLISDGGVLWIVDDVRDGARVGDIILRPTLRDGFVKANGATVKANEYPRLLAWVQESGMTVTAEQYAQDCSKYVYDAAQDKLTLPNATGRVLQGGEQVRSVEAGLPNVTGDIGPISETFTNAANNEKGALYKSTNAPYSETYRDSDTSNGGTLSLDASRSNNIYGSSDTVQPPALAMIAQIKY